MTSFELDAIDRECARRAFWYNRLMHLTTFTYFQIPALPIPMELNLRLPVDEASFEFGAHNSQTGSSLSPFPVLCDQCLILGAHGRVFAPACATDAICVRIWTSFAYRLSAWPPRSSPKYCRQEGLLPRFQCSHPCLGILTARPTAHDEAKAAIDDAEQDISVRPPLWNANNNEN